MKYKINSEKEFPHLIIDNFFTVEELKILWKEIFGSRQLTKISMGND